MIAQTAVAFGMQIIALWVLVTSAIGHSPSAPPSSVSPDKKWQYVGGDAPKIVEVDSNQVALQFSEGCSLGGFGDHSTVLWTPDSRRLAFYSCGEGKEHLTLLYQLRDAGWVALKTPGDGDELFERVGRIIEAQAKRKGLPRKTFLHMQWWTVQPTRWLDSRTLVVYVSMGEVVHRDGGEYVGPGFVANLLLTLKFDDTDDWEVVKTHQMSQREIKDFER